MSASRASGGFVVVDSFQSIWARGCPGDAAQQVGVRSGQGTGLGRPRSRVLSTFVYFFSAPADLLRPPVGVRGRMRLSAALAHQPGRPSLLGVTALGSSGACDSAPNAVSRPPPLPPPPPGVKMPQTPARGRPLRLWGWAVCGRSVSCLPNKTCASGGSLLLKENWNCSLKVKLSGSSLDLTWRAR